MPQPTLPIQHPPFKVQDRGNSKSSRARSLDPLHPVCRGDFAAVVFSGSIEDLGELPGEPTAHALYKFALIDPSADTNADFARRPGMPLSLWPEDRIEPTDGVCFVFGNERNPALHRLIAAGAQEDHHFVIAGQVVAHSLDGQLLNRLSGFVRAVPDDGEIVILGYGHQGMAIAEMLRKYFNIDPARIRVYDGNPDSQHRALDDGLTPIRECEVGPMAAGVIYSPLAWHERLHRLWMDAEADGLPVFDNSRPSSGLQQYVRRGSMLLDAQADGALAIDDGRVVARGHGLALTCHVICEDRRRIAGVEFPHLHGGHQFTLLRSDEVVDLSEPSPFDPLARSTHVSALRQYLSIRTRADLGFFAARDLCLRLWPQSTQSVFPSNHVVDLGATSFERLLHGHLVGREIASTMQTPAQRAALGIIAHHYAANRPIIEIGSAFGGSALLMAAATEAHRPPIVSIDPEASTRDIMRFAFQREGHLDRLTQIIKTSTEAVAEIGHLRGKAGLVFIDGLHTVDGAASDLDLYAPLVAPGGALLFHDTCPQIHSVFRVVIERVLCDARFEMKCLVDGLVVFERRC